MSDRRLIESTFEHEWVFCRYAGCGWQLEFQDLGLALARMERDLHQRGCEHRFE